MSFGDETLNPAYATEDRLRDEFKCAIQLLELCCSCLSIQELKDVVRRVCVGELTTVQAWWVLQSLPETSILRRTIDGIRAA